MAEALSAEICSDLTKSGTTKAENVRGPAKSK